MGTTLVICLFLATHLHAESIASSSNATSNSTSTTAALDNSLSEDATTSSSLFDADEELAKTAASCLSKKNLEELTGNIVRNFIASIISEILIKESVDTIGLTELRATLKFAPLRPWQHCNSTKPSESDLASAPTIEPYYDLKEPSSQMRNLDSDHLFEHNLTPSIAYLDKRFPSIRTIFKRKFEEIRRSDPEVLDRKVIDRMIDEFRAIRRRVNDATEKMKGNFECFERVQCVQ